MGKPRRGDQRSPGGLGRLGAVAAFVSFDSTLRRADRHVAQFCTELPPASSDGTKLERPSDSVPRAPDRGSHSRKLVHPPRPIWLAGSSPSPTPDMAYVADGGEFTRDTNYIATSITNDGRDGYPVQPGRYRLVVARPCPWANRAIIVRRLLGLESAISIGFCGPPMTSAVGPSTSTQVASTRC
jgi:hypothetical protein